MEDCEGGGEGMRDSSTVQTPSPLLSGGGAEDSEGEGEVEFDIIYSVLLRSGLAGAVVVL